MAGVGREPQLETETELDAAVHEGATFELGDDGTRLASQERQGQRRAGAPNGSPLVCGRSIEEANCTSLPFRSDASFFAPRQLATMRPTPALTEDACTNFPSAMELVVDAGNERSVGHSPNTTSDAFVELSMDDSSYLRQTDDMFEVSAAEPSISVTIRDESAEDANKRCFSSGSASEHDDEDVNPNLTVESPNAPVATHDEIAKKVPGCESLNESIVFEFDSYPNSQPGCLVNEMRSVSNAGKTVTRVQVRNTVGRLERHLQLLEGIPAKVENSSDSGKETNAIAENCAVARSSGTSVTSAYSLLYGYSIEEALSRAYNEVFPTPEARSTRFVRIFDLRATRPVINITRRSLADELLIIGGVPAGAWWNKDGVFNFESTREARGRFALETIPESTEPPQWIDVSRDLSRGMVVSMSDAGVTTGPTNALYETQQAHLFSEGLSRNDIDRHTDLVPDSSPKGETGCQDLPALLPLALPQVERHAAFRYRGSIHGCNQAPVFPGPLHYGKAAVPDYRCLLRITNHPSESLSPNVSKIEAEVTTYHPVDDERNSIDHNADLAACDIGACVELGDETPKCVESTKNGASFAAENALAPSGEASSKRGRSVQLETRPAKSARVDTPGVEPGTQRSRLEDGFVDPRGPRCDFTSSPVVSQSQMNGANELASAGQNPNRCDWNVESCVLSPDGQMKGEVSPHVQEDTLALSQSAAKSNSSGSVFRTGNSDESYSVPCAQASLNEVEEHDRSFYECEYAASDVLKRCLPEMAGGVDLEVGRDGYLDDLSPTTSAEIEERRNQIRLLVQSQALRPSTPLMRVDRRTGSVSSCNVDDEESFEEGGSEEHDSSHTLHTTSDDLSECEEADQLSCYCAYSDDSASSSGVSGGASNRFGRLTQYTRRDAILPEDTESNDELFTPIGCSASSFCRKRKANFSPEGSPESPLEDPLAGLAKKALSVQLESAVRATPLAEPKSKDDIGMVGSVTAQTEDLGSSVTTPTDNGSLHRVVLSQHNYCKYSSDWSPSFRREEDLDERYPRRSNVDGDAMEVSPVSSETDGGHFEARNYEDSTNYRSIPREGVTKLVDYLQLTPPEQDNNSDSTPPAQQSQRCPPRGYIG
ncbi:hypothetical protein MTO96_024234 [Rhipicephalus appendiculatus]